MIEMSVWYDIIAYVLLFIIIGLFVSALAFAIKWKWE
jgi:hypothetical protein